MTIFDFISLFGGLALFLYGMRLMGDGLKHGSSGAFKTAMEKVTNNPVVGFLLGLAVTAVIQSSTATIVITSGLVGAGIDHPASVPGAGAGRQCGHHRHRPDHPPSGSEFRRSALAEPVQALHAGPYGRHHRHPADHGFPLS